MSSNTGLFPVWWSAPQSIDPFSVHGVPDYTDWALTCTGGHHPSMWGPGVHNTHVSQITPGDIDLIWRLDDFNVKSYSMLASCNAIRQELAARQQVAMALEYAGFDPFLHIRVNWSEAALEPLRALEDDWDGYGALKIRDDTVAHADKALVMILEHAPMPDIAPNPNGTISFEWDSDEILAHLEVGSTRFSGFIRVPGKKTKYFEGAADQVPVEFARLVGEKLYPEEMEFVSDDDVDESQRWPDMAITKVEFDGGHVPLAA